MSWLTQVEGALVRYGQAKEVLDGLIADRDKASKNVADQEAKLIGIEDRWNPTLIDHVHELPEGVENEYRGKNGHVNITRLRGPVWPKPKVIVQKLLAASGGSRFVRVTAKMDVQRATELNLYDGDGEPVREVEISLSPIKENMPAHLLAEVGAKAPRNKYSLVWHANTPAKLTKSIARGATGAGRSRKRA